VAGVQAITTVDERVMDKHIDEMPHHHERAGNRDGKGKKNEEHDEKNDDEKTEKHYDEKYWEWQKDTGNFSGLADSWKFASEIRRTDIVADVGGGGGFILMNLNCAKRILIELNPNARNFADASIEKHERIEEVPSGSVDVVISHHALEHMVSPMLELKRMHRILKPEGKVVIVVPHDSVKAAGPYNENDLNHHLYTWNRMSLGHLVHDAGFRVTSAEHLQHAWPDNFEQVWKDVGPQEFHERAQRTAKAADNYQVKVVGIKV